MIMTFFMRFYSPEVIHKCGRKRVHSVQNGLIKKAFVARGKLKCWKIATIPAFDETKHGRTCVSFISHLNPAPELNSRFLTKFHLSKFYFQADRPE